jgi:regulation of enolase protein 1 (concanavalin A-like superfamily)
MSRTHDDSRSYRLTLLRDRARSHSFGARHRGSALKPWIDLLESRTLLSVGGGYSNGGLTGQYFTNTNLTGTPAFTRVDDRIDFNWGSTNPAGSSSVGFAGFPSNNWSAEWSGHLLTPAMQIIGMSAQSYTFSALSDSGIRVIVNGKTIINDFTTHAPKVDTATVSLAVGTSVSIEVDYFHASDTQAIAQLSWSGPGFSSQGIDVASPVGLGLNGLSDYVTDYTTADLVKAAGAFYQLNEAPGFIPGFNYNALASTDVNGNPTQDFGVYLNQMAPEAGTYTVSGFANQQPQIAAVLTPASVGNVSYNSTTHFFSATINVQPENVSLSGGGIGQFVMEVYGTGGGVTGLKVMRPTFPGSTTSYDPSVLFNPTYEALADGSFSALRFMDLLQTNGNTQQNWSDRILPSNAHFTAGLPWEDVVRLANETGKDIWINIPQGATNVYLTNLAELLKYGSDGVNSYTSPQANPVYPGLNPGIRVYIEYSNEVWNFGFAQWGMNQSEAEAAVAGNSAEGQIINFDGVAGTKNADGSYAGEGVLNQRYHALRTLETSNIFRSVWGDAAMGSAIRPVLEWQYGGGWYGDDEMLPFLNTYYNNADGQQHVAVPHPVNYFLWGGGGGWYTTVNDPEGNSEVAVTNSSFESGTTGWTFTGTAGVVANGNTTLNPPAAPNGTNAAFVTGTGSFSQTVNIPASEYVDINFNASYTGSGDTFNVYLDNTLLGSFTPNASNLFGRNFTSTYTDWAGVVDLHTNDLAVTAGNHMIKVVGTGTGTSFIDQVHVGTVDGIYNSGLVTLPSVNHDVTLSASYGLQEAGYEGGFLISDVYSDVGGTALQQQAILDPRAQQSTIAALDQYEQSGGNLPLHYGVVGGAYNITDNTFDASAPKLVGYQKATSNLPLAPTNGVPLPTRVGSSISLAEVSGSQTNYINPSPYPASTWNLLASVPGTYSVTFYGHQESLSALEHLLLDGQRLPGAASLPYLTDGTSTTLTFAINTPGLYGLGLFNDGPARMVLPPGGNVTVTLVSTGAPGLLPTGWTSSDAGSPALAGNAVSYDGSNWTLQSGGLGIGTTSDQFQFARVPHSGDGTIVARVVGVTPSAPAAQAGVMFRDGTGVNAVNASVFLTANNGVVFQYRTSVVSAVIVAASAPATGPEWVRLIRKGNTFSAYYSSDGTTWTQLGSTVTIVMNTTVQVGLATASDNSADLTTANFTNVSVTNSTSQQLPGGGIGAPGLGAPGNITNPIGGSTPISGSTLVAPAALSQGNPSGPPHSDVTGIPVATSQPVPPPQAGNDSIVLGSVKPSASSQPIASTIDTAPKGSSISRTGDPTAPTPSASFTAITGPMTIKLEATDNNGGKSIFVDSLSINSTLINNTSVTAMTPSSSLSNSSVIESSPTAPSGNALAFDSTIVSLIEIPTSGGNSGVVVQIAPMSHQGVVSGTLTTSRRSTTRIASAAPNGLLDGFVPVFGEED